MLRYAALVALVVLVPPLVRDLFRPTVRRLGLRNAVRRPGESALVVVGSMLATALITASFLIGDSFGASVRSQAGTSLGPIDEIVPVADIDVAVDLLRSATVSGEIVDGVLGARYGTVSAGGTGDNATVLGRLELLEVDVVAAAVFGDDPDATGLAGLASIEPDQVVVAAPTADTLGVEIGDRVQVFVGDDAIDLEVAAVVDRTGLTGFGDLVTGPGAVTASLDDPDAATVGAVLVSNTGGATDGADLTDDVVAVVHDTLGADVEVLEVKRNLLDEADGDADAMTELFGTIGGFSVVAGVLLLVNLFVMLAQERRRELGTMAAIGLDRAHLRRAFALEGAVYGLLAAVSGSLAGIVVAAVVTRLAPDISGGTSSRITLDVRPLSVVTGAAVGFAISQLTVTVTALRLTRVEIVSALKDLAPAPAELGGRRHRLAGGSLLVVAAAALLVGSGDPYVVLVAPALAVLALVPLAAPPVPLRAALAVAGGIGAVVTALAFSLWDDTLRDPGFDLFLVQGVLVVAFAVLVVASLGPILAAPIRRLGEGSTAVRIGLAHPLDRPARSGLLIAMYALVIFTVAFMAILNTVFQQQVPDLARQAGGSFDLVLDTNPTNPLTVAELGARGDVALAVEVPRGELDYVVVDDDEEFEDWWWASVVAPTFPTERGPETVARSEEFATDPDAWSAVAADDGWIIVPASAELSPGTSLDIVGPEGPIPVRVAATVEYDWALDSGFWVGPSLAASFEDGVDAVSRHYLVAAEGTTASALAERLGEERTHGAVATTFVSVAQADVDEQQTFIRLLQGYLGLGLVIGIAGLAVVLIRAVRERRSQLATLAAIGSPASALRTMIVIEALWVGVQGVLLGLALGVLSAWLVLTKSTAFAADLRFAVPWLALAALGTVALLAALAAGLVPARRAGRIHPAAALRAS